MPPPSVPPLLHSLPWLALSACPSMLMFFRALFMGLRSNSSLYLDNLSHPRTTGTRSASQAPDKHIHRLANGSHLGFKRDITQVTQTQYNKNHTHGLSSSLKFASPSVSPVLTNGTRPPPPRCYPRSNLEVDLDFPCPRPFNESQVHYLF